MKKLKKNYTKESYKTREDWLDNRGIGGSSAAAICNMSKWETPLDVYNTLLNGREVKESNSRMLEGTLAEEHIRFMFALEHPEFKVTNPPKKGSWQFRRKDYPLMTVTPDGLFKKENGELWGLEIKDVELKKRDVRESWESNILPNQYYFQVLHYMVVMNDLAGVVLVARMKYFKFDDDNNYVFDYAIEKSYVISKTDELVQKHIAYLEKKEIDFIENNINKKIRPKVVIKF